MKYYGVKHDRQNTEANVGEKKAHEKQNVEIFGCSSLNFIVIKRNPLHEMFVRRFLYQCFPIDS